ncbi:AAA family ATPase [Nocardia sp. R6R-6]|uniref:AAA family ATPase n=1 Tax=Nocardia sp. R6R-6 TaxID=3459303 RepID=UPI00403E35B0
MPETQETPGHLHETGGVEPTEPFEATLRADEHSQSTGGDADANPFDNPVARANAEAGRAAQEAQQQRLERWGSFRYDAAILDVLAPTATWAWRLKGAISRRNADRDPGRFPPKLVVTGDEVVKFGATDDELKVLPALTDAQLTALRAEAETRRKTDAKRHDAESQRRFQQEQWRELMGSADDDPFIDLRAALALPPRESVWGSVIRRGSVYEVLGAPGSGKTFFVADLCAAMATDQTKFLGAPLTPGRSVIIEAEGADILGVRLAAAAIKYGVDHPADGLAGKVSMTRHAMNLADPAHIERIIGELERTGAAVLVIDTRSRNTLGIEENSATQMAPVYEHLAAIARRTRAAVLVIHHTAKVGGSSRGSNAAQGAIDGEVMVRREYIREELNRNVHFVSLGAKTRMTDSDQEFAFTLDRFVVPREHFPAEDHRYDAPDTREACQVLPVDPILLPSKDARRDAAGAEKADKANADEYAYAEALLRFLGAERAAGHAPPSPSILTRKARRAAPLPPDTTEKVAQAVLDRLAAYGMVREVRAADLPADQRAGRVGGSGKAVVLNRPEMFAAADPAAAAFTLEQWAALSQLHGAALGDGGLS